MSAYTMLLLVCGAGWVAWKVIEISEAIGR